MKRNIARVIAYGFIGGVLSYYGHDFTTLLFWLILFSVFMLEIVNIWFET